MYFPCIYIYIYIYLLYATSFSVSSLGFQLCTYYSLWLLTGVVLIKTICQLFAYVKALPTGYLSCRKLGSSTLMSHSSDIFVLVVISHESVNKLLALLDSFVHTDYPKNRLKIVFIFDQDTTGYEYCLFLQKLGIYESVQSGKYGESCYEGIQILVSQFVKTGKLASQASFFVVFLKILKKI